MESITKTINIDNGSVLVKITMERVRGPNPAIREDLVLDEIGEYVQTMENNGQWNRRFPANPHLPQGITILTRINSQQINQDNFNRIRTQRDRLIYENASLKNDIQKLQITIEVLQELFKKLSQQYPEQAACMKLQLDGAKEQAAKRKLRYEENERKIRQLNCQIDLMSRIIENFEKSVQKVGDLASNLTAYIHNRQNWDSSLSRVNAFNPRSQNDSIINPRHTQNFEVRSIFGKGLVDKLSQIIKAFFQLVYGIDRRIANYQFQNPLLSNEESMLINSVKQCVSKAQSQINTAIL